MADNLKQKTIGGLFWSFIDNFAKLGIQFIVGIILARILSPREFGLVGMLTIFIAVSQAFVDSGFRDALIRKKQCTDADYSTVFYFNLIVAIGLYIILFLSAGIISRFFEEPQLKQLLRVLGVGLIFSSFSIIQQTILTRELNFKLQTYVTFAASLGSGVIAVVMALKGLGVWSLVVLTISRFGLISLLLWFWSAWRPKLVFSVQSFKELFTFGSKLLASVLLDTIYRNVYLLIIGKYFSAQDLGFYTRANQFSDLPSKNITNVIQRVSYPVLSSLQDEPKRLKENYVKLIRSTMMITFYSMLGMAAVAKPMIITLIGEKWEPSVIYLQLLCFVGIFYPLHALNLNMLNVKGRSDLFLKLSIIKKIVAIPVFIVGIAYGIQIMIIGMIIQSVLAFYINSYWSGRLIGYSTWDQIKDILPTFFLAVFANGCIYMLGVILPLVLWQILFIQIFVSVVLLLVLGELLRIKDYIYLKKLILEKLKTIG
ncbi:lipopolysaccharide biosynthesis protein [Maribellus sediminis]|uniref:lipopolysaccharide biosynthesis protein n=1 Tax=Maribellus sediminis TaxID=2696285 RepID=UPI0014311FA2|nr:lipopolysaccharide biosynthesis protein [Maribellus sediminis]